MTVVFVHPGASAPTWSGGRRKGDEVSDPREEKPQPDVLEQQAVIPGYDEDDPDEIAGPISGLDAEAADVLDQRRTVPLPDDDRED
jgi:hypothetical protein